MVCDLKGLGAYMGDTTAGNDSGGVMSAWFRILLVLSTIGLAIGIGRSNWVQDAFARSEGYVVLIGQPVVEASAALESDVQVTLRFRNLSSEPVEILGLKTGCDCTSVQNVPCVIPGRGSEVVTLSVSTRGYQSGAVVELQPEYYLSCASKKEALVIRVHVAS